MSQASNAPEQQVTDEQRIQDLLGRLADAEETIRAIHSGEVDALVVKNPSGPRVYALEGADHPYRVMVERMHESTVTLNRDRVILYSNPQFAALVNVESASVTGIPFDRFLQPSDSKLLTALIEAAEVRGYSAGELDLRTADATMIPVRLSLTPM